MVNEGCGTAAVVLTLFLAALMHADSADIRQPFLGLVPGHYAISVGDRCETGTRCESCGRLH